MSRPKDHFELNAMLNLYGEDGKLQLEKDKDALRAYFREDVNKNTVFFHTLKEKMSYLVDEQYYEEEVLDQYSNDFIKQLYKAAYGKQFRFASFVGAYKYYRSYTLKTFDGERFLERFEDRVSMNALYLAEGDEALAMAIMEEIISGRFQPATPTFLNAGKKQRGELVSCFLLRVEDNMESISRSVNAALQLSKRGGGVAFTLTNLREQGAPIKNIEGQSSGVVPVMKIFEDAFSYANQLGSRAGAGAVYLHAHHPDIMAFLDTKRENADEKVRIKTLSTGVVIPDITLELARENKEMYLFSPYDIQEVYGKPMTDVCVSDLYDEMVSNPDIRKTKINAREFFQTLAELQFESGYPYIMYEDAANRGNPIDGRINMSNLCLTGDTEFELSSDPRGDNAIKCNFEEAIEYVQNGLTGHIHVKTWDHGSETWRPLRGIHTRGEASELIELTVEDRTVRMTPDHEVFTTNRGWVKAKELTYEDDLVVE